jgi:hypothetical protein
VPCAARVVYDYYGELETFPASWTSMMEAVDKGDSTQFNMEEVIHAKRWESLNFIMDSRTGFSVVIISHIIHHRLNSDTMVYLATEKLDFESIFGVTAGINTEFYLHCPMWQHLVRVNKA